LIRLSTMLVCVLLACAFLPQGTPDGSKAAGGLFVDRELFRHQRADCLHKRDRLLFHQPAQCLLAAFKEHRVHCVDELRAEVVSAASGAGGFRLARPCRRELKRHRPARVASRSWGMKPALSRSAAIIEMASHSPPAQPLWHAVFIIFAAWSTDKSPLGNALFS